MEKLHLREPIVAYRAWRIANGLLQSCVQNFIWVPYERMDASCNQLVAFHGAGVPTLKCSCGIYACTTMDQLRRFFLSVSGLCVIGRVALWGKVIGHEYGYRAKFAYPQTLFLSEDEDTNRLIREVADRYATECIPLEYMAA
jgi:hypothetical protein